jgi:hypothetical protein
MVLTRATLSIAALTLANLVPLLGVVWLGWDAAAIVLLYWTENLVIGGYNILKMIVLKPKDPVEHLGKLFYIPFFCVHYGGFCAVHGFFLLTFFHLGGGSVLPFSDQWWPGPLVFVQLLVSVVTRLWESRPEGMEWPVLMLVVSHGVSFVQNYLLGGEYKALTPSKLMSQPYKRIVITHVAIIAGGLPVMALGSPAPLLVVLIAIKIGMDIWMHNRSHRAATGKATEEAAARIPAADD